MKAVVQLIRNYLREKDTDYAVMLTGAWGSGKTYYVRNDLPKHVITIQVLDENNVLKNYEMLYLSVKGIDSIQTLRNKIVLNSQINKAEWLQKTAGAIKSFKDAIPYLKDFDVQAIVESFFRLKSNHLLVVDDLERASSISAKDIVTFLSDYFEIEGNKVLVIANKERLKLEEETQEKYFRYVIKYEPEISDVVENIITKYSNDDTKELYNNFKTKIVQILQNPDQRNFRTIKYFIEAGNQLIEELRGFKFETDPIKNNCINRALDSLFIISVEFKHKKFSEIKADLIQVLRGVEHPSTLWYMKRLVFQESTSKTKSESELYQEEIYETFIKSSGFHPYYEDIFIDYVNDGIWRKDDVEKYFNSLQKKVKAALKSPEIVAKNRIMHPLQLSNIEFDQVIEEVTGYLLKGKYCPEDTIEIFNSFSSCSVNLNLEFPLTEHQVASIIENLKGKVSAESIDFDKSYQLSEDSHNYYKQLLVALITEQANKKIIAKNLQLDDLFSLLTDISIKSFVAKFEDLKMYSEKIYSSDQCSEKGFLKKFIGLKNSSKGIFTDWFYKGYCGEGLNYQFKNARLQEIKYLKNLQILLQQELPKYNKIEAFYIRKFINLIDYFLQEVETI